jgi:hypothetical protein
LCNQYDFSAIWMGSEALMPASSGALIFAPKTTASKKFLVCALSRLSVEDTSDGVPWFGVIMDRACARMRWEKKEKKEHASWSSETGTVECEVLVGAGYRRSVGVNNKPGGWSYRKTP